MAFITSVLMMLSNSWDTTSPNFQVLEAMQRTAKTCPNLSLPGLFSTSTFTVSVPSQFFFIVPEIPPSFYSGR